jgi:hypothetical protein
MDPTGLPSQFRGEQRSWNGQSRGWWSEPGTGACAQQRCPQIHGFASREPDGGSGVARPATRSYCSNGRPFTASLSSHRQASGEPAGHDGQSHRTEPSSPPRLGGIPTQRCRVATHCGVFSKHIGGISTQCGDESAWDCSREIRRRLAEAHSDAITDQSGATQGSATLDLLGSSSPRGSGCGRETCQSPAAKLR